MTAGTSTGTAHTLRVPYGDTDQGGVVHHSSYVGYLEAGRVEWLRAHGVSYRDLEKDHRIAFPVVQLDIRYRKWAYFDDVLTVHTEPLWATKARLCFANRVLRDDELLVQAEITLACVDLTVGRAKVLPAHVQVLFPEKAL